MFNIYLSGSITGVKSRNGVLNRFYLKEIFEDNSNVYKYKYKVDVFNPIEHFNYIDKTNYKNEKQIMRYELDRLRKSDLVIVDFHNPNSLGTMAELAIAYEHKIPIIGFNPTLKELHPWIVEMCDVIFDYNELSELEEYVQNNYLI